MKRSEIEQMLREQYGEDSIRISSDELVSTRWLRDEKRGVEFCIVYEYEAGRWEGFVSIK